MVLRIALWTFVLSLGIVLVACAITGGLFRLFGLERATAGQAMAVCFAMGSLLAPPVFALLVTLHFRSRDVQRRLSQAALTDPLTGLPNRRAFFAAARRWLGGGEQDLGVMMVDLDRFKEINDRWGHEAGDAALVHAGAVMAGALTRAAPGGSLLARLGGEEFGVILAGVDCAGVSRAAEAICDGLRGTPFRRDGEDVPLTASVGVWRGRTEEVDGPLAAADRAVYRAKAAGRDRWEVASEAEPSAALPRVRGGTRR